jgi:uncharacterized protein YndB with AHSA1/START domain
MNEQRVKFQNLSDSAVEAKIDIKASPEKVFRAWTNQNEFVKWFGPRTGGRVEVSEFNPTVGGRYDVTMVFEDGDRVQLVGTFEEVEPPKKLVLTWQWAQSPTISQPTTVAVEIAPSELGSTLTLTHSQFVSVADRDQHESGWAPIVARLASVLEANS